MLTMKTVQQVINRGKYFQQHCISYQMLLANFYEQRIILLTWNGS